MKMNLRWIFGGILSIVLVPLSQAAQLLATVDKTKGSIEDTFILTLTIREAHSIPHPELPSFSDFETRFQGQTSQVQYINGKRSAQIEFKYSLLPRKIGRLTIPAIAATLDGQKYQTEPIHLYVAKASDIPAEEKPAFVQSYVSVKHAYPNQQILYTFDLYMRKGLQVSQLRFERPELSAFHVEELGRQEPITKRLGGRLYEIFSVHLILYPHKIGTIAIPPATLHGEQVLKPQLQSLFNHIQPNFFIGQGKPFQLRTAPMTLEVLPIPTENQPKDYYGLVGTYDLQTTLSQQEVQAGESATLKIIVTGTGRAESVRKPPLNFDKSIKVYEDQPTYGAEFQDKQQVSQTIFTMAVVPSAPGTYHFPSISLPFFDPKTQSFEIREAKIPPLKVTPGESQELHTVGGGSQARKVKRLGEDLLPVHQNVAALQDASLGTSALLLYGTLFFLGPFCFGIGWLWKWKIEHSIANVDKIRSSQAFSKFQKTVKQHYSDIAENEKFAEAMMVALKNYIGDKANKYGEALTSQEVRHWLKEKQVDEESGTQLGNLLEQCEMAKYAANALSEGGKEQIYQAGQSLIQKVEEQLK